MLPYSSLFTKQTLEPFSTLTISLHKTFCMLAVEKPMGFRFQLKKSRRSFFDSVWRFCYMKRSSKRKRDIVLSSTKQQLQSRSHTSIKDRHILLLKKRYFKYLLARIFLESNTTTWKFKVVIKRLWSPWCLPKDTRGLASQVGKWLGFPVSRYNS